MLNQIFFQRVVNIHQVVVWSMQKKDVKVSAITTIYQDKKKLKFLQASSDAKVVITFREVIERLNSAQFLTDKYLTQFRINVLNLNNFIIWTKNVCVYVMILMLPFVRYLFLFSWSAKEKEIQLSRGARSMTLPQNECFLAICLEKASKKSQAL